MSADTFDITPSWSSAALMISMILEDPDARMTAKDDARKELMRMGALLDKVTKGDS